MGFFCCGGDDAAGEKKKNPETNNNKNNDNKTNDKDNTNNDNNDDAQHHASTASNSQTPVPMEQENTNDSKSNNKDDVALLAFGHPLLDMISVTEDEFLEKYNIELGSSNLVKEEQMPIFRDMASHPENVQYVAGGSSMNTARIVRWILRCASQEALAKGKLTSTKTVMVGAVGDDEFEQILRQALERETVDQIFFKKQFHTGTCAVLVVDAERSLLANLGAAIKLEGKDVFGNDEDEPSKEAWNKTNNDVIRALLGCKAVYMEGFFMNLAQKTTSIRVAEKCTELNKTLAFNLSAPYLCSIFPDSLKHILPNVDILFGSRIDAVAYGKTQGWACCAEESEEDLGEVVRMLASDEGIPRNPNKPPHHRRIVVITDGANATVVGVSPSMADMAKYREKKAAEQHQNNVDEELLQKAPMPLNLQPVVQQFNPDLISPEQIVDSNGAGDAFAGGFLSGYLLGYAIDRAVSLGHAAASVVLKYSGCTFPSVPPFELSEVHEASHFKGSLIRRGSTFGRSFVRRRKSEASSGGAVESTPKSTANNDSFFEDDV